MRPSTGLLVFALALLGCTNEGSSADTSESTGDDPGTSDDDDVGSSSETTSDGETTDDDDDGDEVPDCTPGAFGCTCAEGETCSPDLECIAGMCTFSDCSAGYDGCPCAEGDTCNEGLFCVEGTCGCLPGSLACGCIDGTMCEGELTCIADECWLMSPYPNCGWAAAQEYYFCGFDIAHPDFPIECPADLIVDQPCPADLTFVGCCDDTGTWWCQAGVIAFMAC
jgi:hypothetical protein